MPALSRPKGLPAPFGGADEGSPVAEEDAAAAASLEGRAAAAASLEGKDAAAAAADAAAAGEREEKEAAAEVRGRRRRARRELAMRDMALACERGKECGRVPVARRV
jgi:hypothetical protein